MHCFPKRVAAGLIAMFAVTAIAQAQQTTSKNNMFSNGNQPVLTLAQAEPTKGGPSPSTAQPPMKKPDVEHEEDLYREVSDFFNIREANPQVQKGEWELEIEGAWNTYSNHHHDIVGLAQSLKYGFTDNFFAEIEVAEDDITDGDNTGAGDIHFILFNRFVRESGSIPSIAGWAEMRIPTGDGSRGVDGTFHGTVTKSITSRFRVHVDGYVETANGGVGHDDDRKHFDWGVGPGVDYMISDETMILANYLMRTNEEEHAHNANIIELGVTQRIYHRGDVNQFIKLAGDVGLDDSPETPNFGAKFLWEIEWK